jgi:hypothetical protein
MIKRGLVRIERGRDWGGLVRRVDWYEGWTIRRVRRMDCTKGTKGTKDGWGGLVRMVDWYKWHLHKWRTGMATTRLAKDRSANVRLVLTGCSI